MPSLDSDIPITVAFILWAISLNSSIFGSRLLMFKWIRCSPLLLKACHSSCLNNWGLLKCPGFRLISPESRSNKGQNELSFLNLNLDVAKMRSSCWECELLTSFVILMVSWVKNWQIKQDFNLLFLKIYFFLRIMFQPHEGYPPLERHSFTSPCSTRNDFFYLKKNDIL